MYGLDTSNIKNVHYMRENKREKQKKYLKKKNNKTCN